MNEDLDLKSEPAAGRWTLGDLIDFEVLHAQDGKAKGPDADSVRSRDESLHAQFLAKGAPQELTSPDRLPDSSAFGCNGAVPPISATSLYLANRLSRSFVG